MRHLRATVHVFICISEIHIVKDDERHIGMNHEMRILGGIITAIFYKRILYNVSYILVYN